MYDTAEGFLHVLCLVDLITVPFIMKTKHRNSEFVYYIRIHFAIVINPCHAHTTAGHTKLGTEEAPVIVFKGCTIATAFLHFSIRPRHFPIKPRDNATEAIKRHTHRTTEFYMIAPGEIEFFIIQQPWSVNMNASNRILIET